VCVSVCEGTWCACVCVRVSGVHVCERCKRVWWRVSAVCLLRCKFFVLCLVFLRVICVLSISNNGFGHRYGVASVSRINKIVRLFYKRAL